MKLKVKGLRAKQTASGIRYYWEPNAIERRANWGALALGDDLTDAVRRANERNADVLRWRNGEETPAAARAYVAPRTVSAIIEAYRDQHLPRLRPSTRKVNETALRRIDQWAGKHPVGFVTRARVRVLRDTLANPATGIGAYPAFKTLKMLRELFAWARRQDLVDINPATEFDLPEPPSRDHIWEAEDIALFERHATALGLPSIGFAVALAVDVGQREGDLLRLSASHWREVVGLDAAHAGALAAQTGPDAGRVMGIYIRQAKGVRWVGVPVAGAMRSRIEAAIAANAARAKDGGAIATTLIVNDRTGLPYQQRHFIRDVTTVRDAAIAELDARAAAEAVKDIADDLRAQATRMRGLQFRDLRRTAVVRMGELNLEDQLISAITGHKLATIKKILEVYMPRTTKMAARAVVARLDDAADQRMRRQA